MKKGISLVALVITIIVLIVLAGTVVLNIGKNGIISRAQDVVNANDIIVAQEKVILEMQTIKVNAELARKTITEYLQENQNILDTKGITFSMAGESITFTVDEKVDVVTDINGKVERAIPIVKLGDAVNVSRYGDIVEYAVSLIPTSGSQASGYLEDGEEWKIFYEDENYLYIIAGDYLHPSLLPNGIDMIPYTYVANYPYSVNWYDRSTESATLTNVGARSMSINKAKQFGLSWLTKDWITRYGNLSGNSKKAVADLFNDAWTTTFGGGINGLTCVAIGSPTLEMWVKSWNAIEKIKLYGNHYTTLGNYYVSKRSETANDMGVDGLPIDNKLYFPHDKEFGNCIGYWIASSAVWNDDFIMFAYYNGHISNTGYSAYSLGIRPVVSILKSAVNITETSLGSKVWNVIKKV